MPATGENNLGGSIGLDITDFRKGISELKSQISNIETSFRASAVTMEDWGNTSNGLKERVNSLREEIDKQKQEMELYRQELTKVSSGSEADQKAADSLTNKMYRLQKQIGYNQKDFQKYSEQLTSVEKTEKENSTATGQLEKSFMKMAEKSRQSTSKIKEHFSNLKSSITGYIAGIVSAVSLKEVVEDTDAAEKNLSQMDSVLKSTGDVSGMAKEQLVELAESESKVTTYSAETTEKAENMLLTFTQIGKNVFPETVQATLDMATAMHMDATQAAEQLGKALNDPATGYSKLQRIGVTFTASQVQTIKAMEKAGNTAGAQKIILQELEKEYGSSAKAAGSTLTGQIQIMQNNVKSAGVQIMGAVLPIVQNILPSFVKGIQGLAAQAMAHKGNIVAAFTVVGNSIKTVFGWVESHGTLVKNTVIGIASAVGVWKTAVLAANVVQAVNNALTVKAAIAKDGLAAGEAALSAAKGNTTLATMALSAATIKDTAQNIAHTAATVAQTAATNAARGAQILFNAALNANPIGIVITLIAALVAALVVLFNKNKAFHDWVINSWNTLKSLATTVGNGIKNAFSGAWSNIKNTWQGAGAWFENIWSDIQSGFQRLNPIQWGRDLINGLANGIRSAANHVKQAVGNVAQNIRSFLHFSVPDEGPLTDYENWMPDMMVGLAHGIEANKYKVVSAMRNLATDMSISPTVQTAYARAYGGAPQTVTNNTSAPVFYITINAAGADVPKQQDMVALAKVLGNRIALSVKRG